MLALEESAGRFWDTHQDEVKLQPAIESCKWFPDYANLLFSVTYITSECPTQASVPKIPQPTPSLFN
jgi:hypothetical protein